MKFHHIICWGNFGDTDTFPITSKKGNGNFRLPSTFHRNLTISLKFPPKNYGEIFKFVMLSRTMKSISTNFQRNLAELIIRKDPLSLEHQNTTDSSRRYMQPLLTELLHILHFLESEGEFAKAT